MSGRGRCRVQLIHPRPIDRKAMRMLLQQAGGFEVIDAASNCDQCAASRPRRDDDPDVVVCCLQRNPDSNPETAREAKMCRGPLLAGGARQVPAVALIDTSDPHRILAQLNRGFTGVVTATATPETLFRAIEAVGSGEFYLDQVARDVLLRRGDYERDYRMDRTEEVFTEREKLVFNLLADGRSSDEIAQTTNLSPGSVKRCVGSLLLKLGVGGRVASVAAAISLGSYLSMD